MHSKILLLEKLHSFTTDPLKRVKEQKLLILNNIIQIFLVRRRAYNDPYFGSLEYMQYVDYGLQLLPNAKEYLIRNGFDMCSLKNDKNASTTYPSEILQAKPVS